MVFSFSVWLAPVSGTFPVAGPYSYPGHGGYGLTAAGMAADLALVTFLRTARAKPRPYALLTVSADQASPLILLGVAASAEGGYNTTDPALSGDQLATLVSEGRARYMLVSGIYSTRGRKRRLDRRAPGLPRGSGERVGWRHHEYRRLRRRLSRQRRPELRHPDRERAGSSCAPITGCTTLFERWGPMSAGG
jgi:hypothetical protein